MAKTSKGFSKRRPSWVANMAQALGMDFYELNFVVFMAKQGSKRHLHIFARHVGCPSNWSWWAMERLAVRRFYKSVPDAWQDLADAWKDFTGAFLQEVVVLFEAFKAYFRNLL